MSSAAAEVSSATHTPIDGRGEQERSSYIKMLSNIANDLDLLLTDLCHLYPLQTPANQKPCFGFQATAATEGQDISPYDIPREQMRNFISGSKQSLHSLSASEQTSTADSGHDITTPGSVSPEMPLYHVEQVVKMRSTSNSPLSDQVTDCDQRPISLFERLSKTHSIWLLPDIGRSGAVHLLKDRETGSFVVRRSSQRDSLALSVQHHQEICSNVDHYIIENTDQGMRLQGSAHYFSSIPHLIEFYILHKEDLPTQLVLPSVIMNAKSPKELSSLSLLGPDFWQSSVSKNNSTESLTGPVLHKSCSEPINITRPTSIFPPELPDKVKNGAPSHSLCDFSKFIIDKKHARIEEEGPPLPPKFEHMDSVDTEPGGQRETEVRFSQDLVPSVDDGDASSCDRSDVSHRYELRGYKEQVEKSQTHPRASNKGKQSLYFTTSLDLLHIPEPSYFRSSLEDKMSDYEDIWKNSICESDNVKNSVRCNMWTQTHDSFSSYNPRVHNDISPTQNESGISTLSSDGGSLSKNNVQKALAMSTVHQISEQPQVSVTATSDQKVLVAQTQSSSSNVKDQKRKTYVVSNYQQNQKQQLQQQKQLVMTIQQQQCPMVFRRESPNASSAPKTKPPPLPSLSRIKSSSTSSLSTLAHSPIYAEPADAVNLGDNLPVSVRIRRRSAPSYGPHEIKKPDQNHLAPPSHQHLRVSQQPQLETIFSPRNVPNSDLIADSRSFVFSFGHQHQENVKVAETKSSKRAVTRSQSMRTSSPVTNHKVTRQRSLKEKFAKLKIDVLRFRNPDNNKTPASTPDSEDQRPRGESGIDDALFSLEDLEKNVGSQESPTLNKFPVYKKQTSTELNRQSCFSESSTVQDMISCAHPEFNVRPIQPLTVRNVKCVSEYDNLRNAYAPPSATASTAGTVFCKPWDNSPLEKLLHSQNGALQPAMNAEERVQRWQETSQFQANRVSSVSNQIKHESIGQMSDVPSVDSFTNSAVETRKVNVAHSRITRGISFSRMQNSNTYVTDSLNSAHVNVALDDTQGGIILDPSEDDLSEDLSEVISSDLRERLRPIVSQSSHSNINTPGGKIREYIFRLSTDRDTTFGCTIENFIQCTLESQETNPHNVMRNVRQFMTGIKNYLVKHGEGELEGLIERERTKLGASEFLNIDAIIESALHVCVLRPVKHHIYKLFVEEHTRSGSLKLMTKNIKYARTKTPEEIGIKPGIRPPKQSDMEVIKHHLDKMQKAYSPLKKLENLLSATSTIYQCVKNRHHMASRGPQSMGADDFLPMLIYVLVQCGLVSAEIEADFMWGLLHPSLLTGEGGYYLTTLSSAVIVLKNFQEAQETKAGQHHGRLPSISDMQGFLKIAIPDELRDSIIWKTLPIRPNMSTKDVCALIAHKFKVTNPQDYSLYLLVDGEETHLADNLCPQMIKGEYLTSTQEVVFAYKRMAANIAWPRNLKKPAVMQDKV